MANFNDLLSTVANTESGNRDRKPDGTLVTSPKGAEGKMQVMPTTNANPGYGVTPARDSSDAERTRVGEDYLVAMLTHYDGDTAKALAAYNAGPGAVDRAVTAAGRYNVDWMTQVPSETQKYVKKNMGALSVTDGKPLDIDALRTGMAGKSFMDLSPDELIYGRNPNEHQHIGPLPKPETPLPMPLRKPDEGFQAVAADEAGRITVEQRLADEQRATSFTDKVAAGIQSGLTYKALDWLDRVSTERDPTFKVDIHDAFAAAQDNNDLGKLLASQSQTEYDLAKTQMAQQAQFGHTASIGGGADAFLVQMASGLLDPLSLAAVVGTEGLADVATGSRAAMSGVGSLGRSVGVGAVSNVAITGALNATGEQTTPADYLMSAATGGMLGALTGLVGPETVESFGKARQTARIMDADLTVRAKAVLGENATDVQVATKKAQLAGADVIDRVKSSLTNMPSTRRMMPLTAEDALTADAATKERIVKTHNLDTVVDTGERDAIAEIIAQSEQNNAANPINPKGLTKVSAVVPEGESTGMTMLKSNNPVAQAYASTVLESTTGAAGRGETAAVAAHTFDRWFNQDMFNYPDLYHEFRKQEGRGLMREWDNPTAQREFNSRVWYELHARGPGQVSTETSPLIHKAADMAEAGYGKMLTAMKDAGTIGSTNLPDTAVGYVSHRISAEKAIQLKQKTPGLYKEVANVLSKQFQELNTYWQKIKRSEQVEGGPTHTQVNFDKEFSDNLALKYLERGVQKATGSYEMPMNIHEPDAADIVQEALEAMNMSPMDVQSMMSAYSRGGAGFTKGRLQLNVFQTVTDDAGNSMKIGDLFEHDMQTLYKAYSRRASSEVALAHHGIMGSKGLKLIRRAMEETGADVKTLRAFDQTASEFLNQSFGTNKHPWMQNLTMLNASARLGMSVFNQLGDYSAGVVALGVGRSIQAVGALPRMLGEIKALRKGEVSTNPILRTIDPMGYVGLDNYQFQRMLDQKDYNVQLYGRNNSGPLSRVIRNATEAQFIWTGHRAVVAAQVRGMSEQIVRKAMEFIHLGKEDVALRDMGFTEPLMAKLRATMLDMAEFKSGKLQALDLEKANLSMADKMELRQIIDRGSSQIIQHTYIGETGAWVHNDTLKMLYQFRSYSLTAMEKQWSRTVMNRGHIVAFGALMGSLSWAIPIHMARLQLKTAGMNESDRQDYLARNGNPMAIAHSAINYVNAAGLSQDVFDAAAGMYATVGGQAGKDAYANLGLGSSSPKTANFVGGVIAPPIGYANDAWAAAHGNTHKLMHILPGSNMMFVQPFINAIEKNGN
jgi:hypothetical protein